MRCVASNGYILVNPGKEHHLSDVRGYAYEHRIKAEEKIGRRLRDGEVVHHKDGDRTNNDPENLEVLSGIAEHLAHHRKRDIGLRNPGEENPKISCACGCKKKFTKFDASGRPRRFISGHNPHNNPTEKEVLRVLSDGKIHKRLDIVEQIGGSGQRIYVALSKLKRRNIAVNVSHGSWRLTGGKYGK